MATNTTTLTSYIVEGKSGSALTYTNTDQVELLYTDLGYVPSKSDSYKSTSGDVFKVYIDGIRIYRKSDSDYATGNGFLESGDTATSSGATKLNGLTSIDDTAVSVAGWDNTSDTVWTINTGGEKVIIDIGEITNTNLYGSGGKDISITTTDVIIELRRAVQDRSTPAINFSNASLLTEQDLDNSTKNTFHIAQEAINDVENALIYNVGSGTWKAHEPGTDNVKKIEGVADGTADNDATNVGQFNTHDAAIEEQKVATLAYKEDTEDYKLETADWATKVGGVVNTYSDNVAQTDGSEYSAKEYSQGTTVATGSAKQWALGGGSFVEGTAVAGGVYSAKRYASLAATSETNAAADLATFQSLFHGASTSTPSSNVSDGDLWFDTNTGVNIMKVYNATATAWEQLTPSSGDQANITAVAGVATEIGRLGTEAAVADMALLGLAPVIADMDLLGEAGVIGDIETVADITAGDVSKVADITTGDVSKVASITTGDVSKVADITTGDVTKVASITTGDVSKVADIDNEVSLVAAVDGEVALVSAVDGEVALVAAVDGEIALLGTNDMAHPTTGHLALLGTTAMANTTNGYLKVLGNSTVTEDMALLGAAGVIGDIEAVADNSGNINLVGDDLGGNYSNIFDGGAITDSDVSGSSGTSKVSTVAGSIDNVNTVADSIEDVNRYAAEYIISDSEPSSPTPEAGDLWYDGTNDVLKFYNGSSFITIAEGDLTSIVAGTGLSGTSLSGPIPTLNVDGDLTLTTPALGTPASGVMTNVTGTAASLTAGNVTTNANLTGPITSTGNATAIAADAISGDKIHGGTISGSPTLVTPDLGTPSAMMLDFGSIT